MNFTISLPLDVLNATLTALTAQQQALGNAVQIIKDQAQAQVDAASKQAVVDGVSSAFAEAREKAKAAEWAPEQLELPI